MLPDYSKGKIYKLVSNKTDDIYIGSCLMTLSTRLSNHKNKSNGCSSKKLFEDDAIITIVLIELCPCNSKNELKARELFHITNTPCINANKPFVSTISYGPDGKEWAKDYRKGTIEHKRVIQRKYQDLNKEYLSENRKLYREANLEYIKNRDNEYNKTRKEEKKLYYQVNKQLLSEKAKKYRELNKEQIKEKNNVYNEANKEKLSIRRKELYQIKKALKATIQTA